MNSRLRMAGLALVIAAVGCKIASTEPSDMPGDNADFETQVEAVMGRMVDGWNSGDFEEFMSGYHRSPLTTFLGIGSLLATNSLIVGYDGIRAHYEPHFVAGAQRDRLSFTNLHSREVSDSAGVITARYALRNDGAVTASGAFTLVFLNLEGTWLIVHDHTSGDPGG